MGNNKRVNGEGSLRIRGNVYWVRWMYHGEVHERSTKIRVDMVDENGEPCGRKIAEDVMKTFLEPFKHRAEADALSLLENRISNHRDQEERTDPDTEFLTLGDIADAFDNSTRRNDISPKHLRTYKSCANEFAKFTGMSVLAKSVTERLTTRWANYLWAQNVSASTFNGKIAMMRQIWKALAPTIGVRHNPWSEIKKKKSDTVKRRCFTESEIQDILKTAGDFYGGDARMLVIIGVNTGMRIGDCATLRWSEIDMARGFIHKITEKTKKLVHIPILPELMDALKIQKDRLESIYKNADMVGWESYWEGVEFAKKKDRLRCTIGKDFRDFVCPRIAQRHLHDRTIVSTLMSKMFRKAGINTSERLKRGTRKRGVATFHCLRHTMISRMAESGVPITVAKEIIGHRSTAISEHYTHISEDYLKSEMMKLVQKKQ